MRSMKKSDIKILKSSFFTAAIDVGMWSNHDNFLDPSMYPKDYENLIQEPREYFNYHEPNIQQFLDLEYLLQIFPVKLFREDKVSSMAHGSKSRTSSLDLDNYTTKFFNSCLQDLMMTFPTLLIIQNRKEEALYCLERCIVICEKYRFTITKAKLSLMIASLYLNDDEKVHADVWEKAQAALSLFISIGHKEGKAEANFLLGMNYKRKARRAPKMDSISLRKQPKSDKNMFDTSMDGTNKLMKSGSGFRSLKEEDKNYLEIARSQFLDLKHQYGVARVSKAMAVKKIAAGLNSKSDMDEVERYLNAAVKGFKAFKDNQSLISCYVKLGNLKLVQEEYEKAKECAEKADELSKLFHENYFVGELATLLDQVNEHIRCTSMNVFVFLKAFPLVDPNDVMHVGPITQKHNKFKETLIQAMKNENKVIQVKFDILTRESLSSIKTHGCRVLHLSSDDARESQL